MSHSVSSLPSVSEAIAALRTLSQASIQATWRYYDGDLATADAVQPSVWQDWKLAELNAREHIAWPKGRHVRWLGQTIVVPETLQDYPLQGLTWRLSLGWWAESALVFINGQLVQEGDLFDWSTRLLLSAEAVPGQEMAIAVRLVSPGHDDGALMRSLCLYEASASHPSPEPGFVADELAVLQHYLQTFEPEPVHALEQAVALIDWSALPDRDTFDQSLTALRQQLQPVAERLKQRRIQLVGHAHLDMAWLWDVEETWRAAERTFESVLNLQRQFPDLTFCHSTPALYEWVEHNRPQLFDRIQQQVRSGRWEVVGGLWIEPELNLINGESLVRQVLYGQRYAQARFGSVSPIAWLPDSFGFCWQLPQILRQGGVDYFVTQKLRWNDTTQFPYDLFWWQSPDGSQILSLMSAPIGEGIDPVKMTTYACTWETKTHLPFSLWLPGVGDHGGGPTRDMLEVAQRWQQSPFFPQVEFTTALQYLQQVEQVVGSRGQAFNQQSDQPALPVWNSELYLEFHRGCYTTHADQKLFNRRSETLLYQAELWAALATISAQADYPKAELEAAWKQTLFNQFHDILPGSAIPQVFVDANQAWEQVGQVCQEIVQQSLTTLAQHIALPQPPHPEARPIVVFNSLNWQRSEVVTVSTRELDCLDASAWQVYDLQGNAVPSQPYLPSDREQTPAALLFQADRIPAIGYCVFWLVPHAAPPLGSQPDTTRLDTASWTLQNPYLRVTIDPTTGDLSSVFDIVHQREVLAGPGNQLQAFQDAGQYWDAWNIDPDYAQHPLPAAELVAIKHVPAIGQVQARIQVVRQLGQSTFYQDYVLDAASPLLKIETRVDWQERHVLVKAAFPLQVEADYATYEIPCGAIQRPTRPQTDREKAQWEVPALRWADLSSHDYGVSLLNDSKHGYDCRQNQLRLTLLRGSEWPNPDADRGWHQFTYALYPHAGRWQAAQTVQRGYALNSPLQAVHHSGSQAASGNELPPAGQLLNLGANSLVLMAFKQAEDSPADWVLRCYESHGEPAQMTFRSPLNLQLEGAIDLLERPINPATIQDQSVTIHPWKIVSLKVSTPTVKDAES